MHDLMVMCEELGGDELTLFRSCASSDVHKREPQMDHFPSAVAEPACETLAIASGPVVDALCWATGIKNNNVLVALAGSLPLSVQEEQLELYKNRSLVPKPVPASKVSCNPTRLAHRRNVCRMLYDRLRSGGHDSS